MALDNIVKSMFDRLYLPDRQNRRLVILPDTLLPKLLSGEIDVSGLENPAQEGL